MFESCRGHHVMSRDTVERWSRRKVGVHLQAPAFPFDRLRETRDENRALLGRLPSSDDREGPVRWSSRVRHSVGPPEGKLGRGEIAVGGVEPVGGVVAAAALDDHAGFQQGAEAPRGEQFITQPRA